MVNKKSASTLSLIRSIACQGGYAALLVGAGHPSRAKMLPDVAAINETVPGFINTGWWGVAAPAGTSKEIVQRLNAAINKALVLLGRRGSRHGVVVAPSTPEQFGAFIVEDHQRWSKVIKDANLTIE